MLKHCSPSAVDIHSKQRVRASTSVSALNNIGVHNSNDDSGLEIREYHRHPGEPDLDESLSHSSFSSSEHSSSVNSASGHPPSASTQTDLVISSPNLHPAFKDASTSPLFRPRQPRGQISQNLVHPPLTSSLAKVKIPVKVYAKCLRSDIEYKTLSVSGATTSREIIWMLLSKYRMRHRDPKLFYLTMDINIKRTGIPLKRSLALDDDSRPVELQSCHPWGECKFSLQARKGGVVRVYDSVLMAESKYKCLLISEHTTVEEVILILFHCYGLERELKKEAYCVYEQNPNRSFQRRLSKGEKPVQVQSSWPNPSNFQFVLRPVGEDGGDGFIGGHHIRHQVMESVAEIHQEDSHESGNGSDEGNASNSEFSRFRDSPVSASSR